MFQNKVYTSNLWSFWQGKGWLTSKFWVFFYFWTKDHLIKCGVVPTQLIFYHGFFTKQNAGGWNMFFNHPNQKGVPKRSPFSNTAPWKQNCLDYHLETAWNFQVFKAKNIKKTCHWLLEYHCNTSDGKPSKELRHWSKACTSFWLGTYFPKVILPFLYRMCPKKNRSIEPNFEKCHMPEIFAAPDICHLLPDAADGHHRMCHVLWSMRVRNKDCQNL